MQVLIIGNDGYSREFAAMSLRRNGYHVTTSRDAQSAGSYVAQEQVGVLVADFAALDQDGLRSLQTMRRLHPSIPMVALADAANAPRSAGRIEAEITVAKPFLPKDIIRAVDRLGPQELD